MNTALGVITALVGAPAAQGKGPPAAERADKGTMMPDLGKVLGSGWTVPPELSDRARPSGVLDVRAHGYRTVMAGCVTAMARENGFTDANLSRKLSGGARFANGVRLLRTAP